MPIWQQLAQQLRQAIEAAVRFIKARRREEATLAFAALLFWAGHSFAAWLPKELSEFIGARGLLIIQSVLYVAGLVLFVYGAVRVWRLVYVAELPPVKDRPSVIKGPSAFTPGDGELFRKLGRENELQELMGYVLDNQVPLVILMGESGAGKTSLLRAGLPNILTGKGVRVHYWEAVPTDSAERLLRAIQEDWQLPTANGAAVSAIPASLDALVNPAAALGMEQHVIVLDQFEQLRGRNPVFQLLRRVAREARPPHRITWVIAFRREYRADWSDFIIPEQKRGFFPKEISMRLFTAEQARDVISQLIQEADLSVEPAVFTNFIEAATNDRGEVVPVDIGIGLLVLAELHDRQGGRTVTISDYQFAGGAEGLLTQYINRCLERFGETERETILKALLALRDPETSQRIAEGLSAEKLATEVGAEARQLRPQLERLAQRDMRLLESFSAPAEPPVASEVRYRLPNERLIPALHRLTGRLLGEIEQAKLKFERAFQAWQYDDKRPYFLLKGNDLRLIERVETQIPWGSNRQEKQSFLQRSKRRRNIMRALAMSTAFALIGLGWVGSLEYQRSEGRRYLSEHNYPPELYDWQYQLKKLELTEPLDLQQFTWLSSDSIEELSLKAAPSSNSIVGLTSLAQCNSLKKLTLDLSESQVSDLKPLEQLKRLTQLTLYPRENRVFDEQLLEQLRKLPQLTLLLGENQLSQNINLSEQLKSLSQLKQLTLYLSGSRVNWLYNLQGLTQLKLDLLVSEKVELKDVKQLESVLKQLKSPTQLKLYLCSIDMGDLSDLEQLPGLIELGLNFSNGLLNDIKLLEQLQRLTQLKQLIVCLRGRELSDLRLLELLRRLMQLKQPTISLSLSPDLFRDIKPLEQLKELTQLIFVGGKMDLEPLAQLSNLTQLTLLLPDEESSLEPLIKLTHLQKLSIEYATNAKRMSLQKIPTSLVELKF